MLFHPYNIRYRCKYSYGIGARITNMVTKSLMVFTFWYHSPHTNKSRQIEYGFDPAD